MRDRHAARQSTSSAGSRASRKPFNDQEIAMRTMKAAAADR